MRSVRRANTKPEVALRKALHKLGFRYVIGDRRLPGTPDIVLPRYRAAVFVHGCFWHGHECRQGRTPSSNVDYWTSKITANCARDTRKEQKLKDLGWRVFTIWECELKNAMLQATVNRLADALNEAARHAEMRRDGVEPKR